MTAAAGSIFAALPDPWADRTELAAAAAECREVRERLLARLADRLDGLHGEKLGVDYWRVVLGSWLLEHLHQLEDRRRRIAAARDQGLEIFVLGESEISVPRDAAEFMKVFRSERYYLQLAALICRVLGGKTTAIRPDEDAPLHPPPSPLRLAYHGARRLAGRAARLLRTAEVLTDGVYPLNRLHAELTKALDFRAWSLSAKLPERLRVPAVFDERRLALAQLSSEGPLESLAVATLPWCLPALWLEGFAEARAHARRTLGPAPRVMLHTVGIHYDDLYKLCAAEAAREGAVLVGVQHGGQYGTAEWCDFEWHERSIADYYFTWGWREDEKTIPMPVPWLTAAPPRAPVAGEVLLVSSTDTRIPRQLFPTPMSGQWEKFISQRESFLAALPAEDLAATNVRLFPGDYGWNERPRLENRFPGIRIAAGPIAPHMARAALIVTDHPGTTMLETFAWDVPALHFWDEKLWDSRTSAREAFEPLRRAGLLHATPESAARQVSAVRRDLPAWWEAPATREARREFARRYARVDRAWPAEWARVLRGAASRSRMS